MKITFFLIVILVGPASFAIGLTHGSTQGASPAARSTLSESSRIVLSTPADSPTDRLLEYSVKGEVLRATVPAEALRSRFKNLLWVETWWFKNPSESERFLAYPNSKGLTVERAVARRFRDRRDELLRTISAFEKCCGIQIKLDVKKLNASFEGQRSLSEVNQKVDRAIDAFLNQKRTVVGSHGSQVFRILKSCFFQLNAVDFISVSGVQGEVMKSGFTQRLWFEVTGTNPSYFSRREYCPNEHLRLEGVEMCPNHPVESASPRAINEFVAILNRIGQRYVYRLPTVAERRRVTGPLPPEFEKKVWFVENSDMQTHPVCSKGQDQNGFCDLRGNLFDLTQDKDGQGRFITAGESWFNRSRTIRNGLLWPIGYDWTPYDVGFRVLRTRAD